MSVRRGTWTGMVAVVLVAAGANVWAGSGVTRVDLSENDRFSLSPESREIARAVARELRITVFLFEGGGRARDAGFLLSRYEALNDRIDHRLVDPDQRPGEARRYGVTDYATVVLEYDGRRLDAAEVTETAISSAILRLVRDEVRVACYLAGHNEPSLDDDGDFGFSGAADLLETNGYEIRTLDLVAEPSVPDVCDLVMVAGPIDPFDPSEVGALRAHLEVDGRLLALDSGPLSAGADLRPVLAPWGVTPVGGLAVDPERSQDLDLSNVVVEEFPSASPVVDAVARLRFPAPGGLLVAEGTEGGRTVSRLAVTSPSGFVEATPDEELAFDEGDIPGPVVVAAAVDASRVEPAGEDRVRTDGPRVRRTRIVVTANAGWAANCCLNSLSNRRFLLNALGWLTEDEQILTVESTPPGVRQLAWTPERQRQTIATTVIGVPAAVLLAGVGQWLLARRGRRS